MKNIAGYSILSLLVLFIVGCSYNPQLYSSYKSKNIPNEAPKREYFVFLQSSPSRSPFNGVVEVVWEDVFRRHCEEIRLFSFQDNMDDSEIILQLSYDETESTAYLHGGYSQSFTVSYVLQERSTRRVVGSGSGHDYRHTDMDDLDEWNAVEASVARSVMDDLIDEIVSDLNNLE